MRTTKIGYEGQKSCRCGGTNINSPLGANMLRFDLFVFGSRRDDLGFQEAKRRCQGSCVRWHHWGVWIIYYGTIALWWGDVCFFRGNKTSPLYGKRTGQEASIIKSRLQPTTIIEALLGFAIRPAHSKRSPSRLSNLLHNVIRSQNVLCEPIGPSTSKQSCSPKCRYATTVISSILSLLSGLLLSTIIVCVERFEATLLTLVYG